MNYGADKKDRGKKPGRRAEESAEDVRNAGRRGKSDDAQKRKKKNSEKAKNCEG